MCGDGTAGSLTGIAPDAIVMCIKSMMADGFGGAVNIAGGMEWAVEHGCDAFSMSLGMANAEVADKELLRRSKGAFTVQCEGMRRVEVFSSDGKKERTMEVNDSHCQIDGLEGGIYLVRVISESGVTTLQIIR